jgi:hypothetical protein
MRFTLVPSLVQLVIVTDNLRLGGAGDQWNPQKGRAGRVLWLFHGFLCGSPRLCRVRSKVLVPVSKY